MGNTLLPICKFCYTTLSKLEYNKQWNKMLRNIRTEKEYIQMVECMFSDNIYSENRIKTLKCFTKDLCKYHNNDAFWDHYCNFEDKIKKIDQLK